MGKYTHGPWRVSETWRVPIGGNQNDKERLDAYGNVFWGYSISGSNENGGHILPTLAAVHNFPDNMEANAALISAAPDLLVALELLLYETKDALVGVFGDNPNDPFENLNAVKKARAAIAKAEGE